MPFSFKPNQEGEVHANVTPPPMDPSMPSTPLGSLSLAGREPSEKSGILQVGLYLIFGATVLVAALMGAYQYYLSSQIAGKKSALAQYEAKLGALPLEDMRKVSNRVKVINQILQEHASVSTAFRVLEDSIENPVTYTRFNLALNPANKTYDLQLGVIAPDYHSIAQQLDTLSKNEAYKEYIPLISYEGINLDTQTGNVSVTFKMPIHIEGKVPEKVTFLGRADNGTTATTTTPSVIVVNATTTTATTTKASSTPPKSGNAPR